MRVRTHPSRNSSSLIRLFLAVATIAAGLVIAPISTMPMAADSHCGGSGSIYDDGGVVSGYCFGYSPGRQPSTAGLTPQQVWAIHCASIAPYTEGRTVTISFLKNADEWEIRVRGLDPTGTYGVYVVYCRGAGLDTSYFVVWELTAPVPLTVLRDRARARINPPDPSVGSNPPLDDPDRFGVVGLPTWLWVNEPWDPIGPESESSGLITVEVMAFPRHVTWEMGDGSEPVVCEGPGVAWTRSMPEDGTYCSHTYTSSSADLAGEAYGLTATVEWYFEWWINGASQGEFDAYNASTSFTYRVGEIQAIESN